MLILTRKIGEDIIIGDDVTITLIGVKGNQARLGIKAPIDISVHRSEVYDRIKKGLDSLVKLVTPHKDIHV